MTPKKANNKSLYQLLNAFLTLLFFIQVSGSLYGQIKDSTFLNPTFDKFVGTVYDMPNIRHTEGKVRKNSIQQFYSDTIYSYDSIQTISLNEINIELTNIKQGGFPGVEQRTKFALILYSKMYIEKSGCYEFNLSSDDGSRLWIADKQIINNDSGHGMKTKKDTVLLNSGAYNIKLWYFQGFPDKLGFVFKSKFINGGKGCQLSENRIKEISKTFTISANTSNSFLFASDQYLLTEQGKREVQKLANTINKQNVSKISIIGHTDSIGSSGYNLNLSKNRAEQVFMELKKYILDKTISYTTIGKGASEPLSNSESKNERKINRRVEIIIQ